MEERGDIFSCSHVASSVQALTSLNDISAVTNMSFTTSSRGNDVPATQI